MKKYISHSSAWTALEMGEITLTDKVIIHDVVHRFEEQDNFYVMVEEINKSKDHETERVRYGTSYGRNRITDILSETS